jgi:hypothetical protein
MHLTDRFRVIASVSEAIQRDGKRLDCFVALLLAMTATNSQTGP